MSLVLIDRKKAAAYGQEAVAITRDGHYVAPSGRRVDIAEATHRARTETVTHAPGDRLDLPAPRFAQTAAALN